MQKNTLVTVVLSMLVVFIWMFYMQKPTKLAEPPVTAVTEASKAQSAEFTGAERSLPAADVVNAEPEREAVLENNAFKAVFTSKGAAIKHWYIKEANGTQTDLVLLQDENILSTYPGLNYKIAGSGTDWINFEAKLQDGTVIRKNYEVKDTFFGTINITKQLSKKAKTNLPVDLTWTAGLGTDAKEMKENGRLTRLIAVDGASKKLIKYKPGEYDTAGLKWAAIDNRYFLGALIFDGRNAFGKLHIYKAEKNMPPKFVLYAADSAAGKESASISFYLGPKGYNHLKTLGLRLDEAVDFGFFGPLGKAFMYTLNYLHDITKNYGWAIVIMTVIFQLVLFPLSYKSLKASISMKKLQGPIEQLKAKYKNDPKRMNTEVLELYKKHNVNPMGGCLPLILQLPIFWALFTTLRNSYELRNAPWIFWVKDLSAPDTLFRIGNLPINIMPLVMGIGMLIQQKMMTGNSKDPNQVMMLYMMPIMFTFIFWSFPSGLVLYWLINNIMTLVEQYFIVKNDEKSAVPVIP